ncbi:MAG: carboxypeptidase-like regulatory domain-containing protein, partial [Bacteroidetes bacterium]|nr:carboxypeptidase-like regulatory domain-containing protein [Bacteroidota bacterium]
MKATFLNAIFMLGWLAVQAQTPAQTVRGKVVDEVSKAPIAFATVVLLNTDPLLGTTTDAEGNFRLAQVPVGRFDLRVSFTGYEAAILRELVVSSAKELNLSIRLKESVTTLNEVVVSGQVNKEEPLNTQATVSARMLSVEEASRYAGGFDDPARLASSFAGVSSNVVNNGIVVRGNAPKSLQWKLEGIEIPNPNHFADLSAFGGGGLTALSSQMLANSDFFTGAFPAEYSNALSGVFDIFMRSGNNERAEHTLQLGLIGIDASSEGPFKKGGQASYLFNYRYSTLALVAPLLPEEAQGTRYQDLSYKL